MSSDAEVMYPKLRGYIHRAVYKYLNKYGGDEHAIISDAHLIYLEAFEDYDPDKGMKFSSWVSYKVYRRLISIHRKKKSELPMDSDSRSVLKVEGRKDRFNVDDFTKQLRQDAAFVVLLVIDQPEEIRNDRKGEGITEQRRSIRRYLVALGWSYGRIDDAFHEVKTALTED